VGSECQIYSTGWKRNNIHAALNVKAEQG